MNINEKIRVDSVVHLMISKVVVLVATGAIFLAPLPTQASHIYNTDIFSINFPDEWVEIPESAIRLHVNQLADRIDDPDFLSPKYECGFQPTNSSSWFDFPYMLVQINNGGRISEQNLSAMSEFPSEDQVRSLEKKYSLIISELQAEKMYYECDKNIIWLTVESDIEGVGRVYSFSAIIPTETGSIQLGGSTLFENVAEFEPIFRSVAVSITPSGGVLYKKEFRDNDLVEQGEPNWLSIAGRGLSGLVVVAFVLIGTRLFRLGNLRKKPKPEDVSPSEF